MPGLRLHSPWRSERSESRTSRGSRPTSAIPDTLRASSFAIRNKRKLIVCCDGTWNNEDSPHAPLTNVARISRCIRSVDDDGIPQVVSYQAGVGSGTSKLSNVVEGATGRGLPENIREAYSFICHNYTSTEDEIYLIGFSRGAFTARSIAALINDVGILTKRGLKYLHDVYDYWNRQIQVSKKPGERPPIEQLSQYCKDIDARGLLLRHVRIRVCAVWDTVGSLGIPVVAPFPQRTSRKLAFVNSILCENIDYGYQALSLNERRRHFLPTVWNPLPPGSRQTLEQCWFLGNHSDVGGGNKDDAFANITLAWMLGKLRAHLVFDTTPLWDLGTTDREAFVEEKVAVRSSKFKHIELVSKQVKIQDSMTGVYRFAGSKRRRPGRRSHDETGAVADEFQKRFVKHETIHFTVRVLLGKGLVSPCEALKDADVALGNDKVRWTFPPSKRRAYGPSVLAEDHATEFEIELLRKWTALGTAEKPIGATDALEEINRGWSLAPALRDSLTEAWTPKIRWSKEVEFEPPLELVPRSKRRRSARSTFLRD